MFAQYFTKDELQARATVAEQAIKELMLDLVTHPGLFLPMDISKAQMDDLTPEIAEWILPQIFTTDRELFKLTGQITVELIDFRSAIDELRLRDDAERDAEYYNNALDNEARWLDG